MKIIVRVATTKPGSQVSIPIEMEDNVWKDMSDDEKWEVVVSTALKDLDIDYEEE